MHQLTCWDIEQRDGRKEKKKIKPQRCHFEGALKNANTLKGTGHFNDRCEAAEHLL